jgi:hypothetical protein
MIQAAPLPVAYSFLYNGQNRILNKLQNIRLYKQRRSSSLSSISTLRSQASSPPSSPSSSYSQSSRISSGSNITESRSLILDK